jgi:hypothetical protein
MLTMTSTTARCSTELQWMAEEVFTCKRLRILGEVLASDRIIDPLLHGRDVVHRKSESIVPAEIEALRETAAVELARCERTLPENCLPPVPAY